MERAGIDDGVARKKDGKLGRNVSRLSFHWLRHSFHSAMANADVPLEIRQKLTGHASQDMNKHYTHLELENSETSCGVHFAFAWKSPSTAPQMTVDASSIYRAETQLMGAHPSAGNRKCPSGSKSIGICHQPPRAY
jgi:hypothetical protein